MAKSVFTDAYTSFREALVALRREAGVSQVELAERLGKPQQFISRYEQGIRRIDVVEFCAIAQALGYDPQDFFSRATKSFPSKITI